MKIVFLLQSFPCVSETFILSQITGLIDSGHEIRIFAFNRTNEGVLHPDVLRYDLFSKTTFINLPETKNGRRILTLLKTIRMLNRCPVRLYRLQRTLISMLPFYDYALFFLGIALMQDKHADVIHCHYGTIGNLAVIAKDIGLKSKVSVVFHGFDLSAHLNKHGSDAYQKLFSKADIFLPISEFWKKKLLSMGCPEEKTVVHRMGIDIGKFEYKQKCYQQGERFKCLTIARLVEKKGHIYVLEAVAGLVRKGYPVVYEIAGDGPRRQLLEQRIDQLGIHDHVIFRGVIDQEECLDLYSHAHCFILPSITADNGDMEGIPMVLMEAMAAGLPVISTYHSGIPELIQDQKTGFLVPEKNSEALEKRLSVLIDDYHAYSVMTDNARKTIERNFEISRLNEHLVQIFTRHASQPADR